AAGFEGAASRTEADPRRTGEIVGVRDDHDMQIGVVSEETEVLAQSRVEGLREGKESEAGRARGGAVDCIDDGRAGPLPIPDAARVAELPGDAGQIWGRTSLDGQEIAAAISLGRRRSGEHADAEARSSSLIDAVQEGVEGSEDLLSPPLHRAPEVRNEQDIDRPAGLREM